MRFLAELLGAVFPEYQYTWLFPDFEESIGLELGKKKKKKRCSMYLQIGGASALFTCIVPPPPPSLK